MSVESIGKVHVLETLGSGAHSSILRVRREADGREYALKVVSIDGDDEKKFLEQAKHEYRVGRLLDHANCIKVLVFETETNWMFRVKKAKLLIEYVPGKTLDKVPLLKMAKLVRVFEQIASGLVHLHKHGVFHADLKPNNIMLGRGNTVKILDYGLAWIKGEPKDRIQGTPEYMAPETAKHKLINERTDIYNFGATMYRLATLQLPVMPKEVEALIGMGESMKPKTTVRAREMNLLVPAELSDLIEDCLAHDANKRPKRMSEIQGRLDDLADRLTADASPDELE